MFLLIGVLLLSIGGGVVVAEPWQGLTCPLRPEHEGLPRVWCRQLSADCCSGFAFQPRATQLDGGRLRVTRSRDSLTVEAVASLRGGVYWCGVLGEDGGVIKLAEGFIHGSFLSYTWSIMRWTALPLLAVFTVFNLIYSKILKKLHEQKEDLTTVAGLADPLCEKTAAPPVELDG